MQHLTRTSKIVGQRCQPKLLFTKQINCFGVQEFDIKKNYYGTLGVQQSASAADIKKAFYKLAKQYHPDVNKGNADKFKEINEAYEVLSDDSKKRNYDDMRKASSSSSSSSGYSSYGSSSNASRASSTGKASGYNPYTANQGQSYGNATGGYYQRGDQNGYYQYDEEMRKQFFKNFYSEQSKQFDDAMKKSQQKYGSKTANASSQNNYKSFDDFFSTVNSEFNRNQANRNQNPNNRTNSQDTYKAFQDEMYKRYKDEEYNRMEEMARLRRQKEVN